MQNMRAYSRNGAKIKMPTMNILYFTTKKVNEKNKKYSFHKANFTRSFVFIELLC